MHSKNKRRQEVDDSLVLIDMASLVFIGYSKHKAAMRLAPRATTEHTAWLPSIARRLEKKFKSQEETLLRQVNGMPTLNGSILIMERELTPEEKQAEIELATKWGRKCLETIEILKKLYYEQIEQAKTLCYGEGNLHFPVAEKNLMPRQRAMQRKNSGRNRKYPFSFSTMRQIKKAGFSKC